jgi:predicted PolB exonuclease-like 3'-5' exonuclease
LVNLGNILFLDIETVSQYPEFGAVPEEWKQLWNKKAESLLRNFPSDDAESIYGRSAIYAEFGKVICISCGIISGGGTNKKLLLKSFYGDDEKLLLSEFCSMLTRWAAEGNRFLCAHNGREFDFPYLCRRLIVNNCSLPTILNIAGKKPWEVQHIDTMELWKFGDYKSFTSLNLLAHTLGIPTPKDDIDGSQVGDVYWKDKNIERIVHYCQKDVVTTVQVYLRLQAEALIPPENIEIK